MAKISKRRNHGSLKTMMPGVLLEAYNQIESVTVLLPELLTLVSRYWAANE